MSYFQFQALSIGAATLIVLVVILLFKWLIDSSLRSTNSQAPSVIKEHEKFHDCEQLIREAEVINTKFDHLWFRGFRNHKGQFVSRTAWLNMSYKEQLSMLKSKGSIRSDG